MRAIIGGAELCVTMKHHPIIFALGEGVPSISLALGQYYEHKNRGALGLFGLESFNVSLDHDDYLAQFETTLSGAWTELGQSEKDIRTRIEKKYPELLAKRQRLMEVVAEALR